MKRIIALALVIAGFQVAMAQDSTISKRPHHGHHPRGEYGLSQLHLTPEQRQQLDKLQKEHKEKMMAILTPEQKAKLEQQRKERANDRQKHRGASISKMKETLQLTDDQAAKMKSIREDHKKQAELIRANSTLAEGERLAQLKKLSADKRSEVNAMLTPEQQEKLKQFNDKHPKRTVR
ncbi:hypothetical protein [Flavihumibacter petaseus]|uniref:Uncharacterized protein n=1 Tax=Flavihumibacter petaseus NBRC 106054 TaxID=1220578 RepID=A0A0E9MWM9_9BACT|nr:hypothetical protein [Flavihumibacter petaseus]GAO41515.1 hypothetical protein FPE01S_01_05290 [Flavihumibacter petaseus NBRC 106054]